MKTSVIQLVLMLLFINTAFAQKKDVNINVNKGGNLEVSINDGNIYIETWNKDIVQFMLNDNEGLKVLKHGNTVQITSENGGPVSELKIKVPENFNLSLNTFSGDIIIAKKLYGDVHLVTSGGDIKINGLKGNLDVKTGGGDIVCKGDIEGAASLITSGGDVKIDNVSGYLITRTFGGDISVSKVSKEFTASTSGGNISAQYIGSESDLETGGGNINLGKLDGRGKIKTAGGDIIINENNKELLIKNNSGTLKIYSLKAPVKADVTSGDLYIKVDDSYSGNSIFNIYDGVAKIEVRNPRTKISTSIKGSYGDDLYESFHSNIKPTTTNKLSSEFRNEFLFNNESKNNINVKVFTGELYIFKK